MNASHRTYIRGQEAVPSHPPLSAHEVNQLHCSRGEWRFLKVIITVVFVIWLLPAALTPASVITFTSSIDFNGDPPAGSPPWLTAKFDDGGGSGTVTLTLTVNNLASDEYVGLWDFNLDPDLDPTALNFAVGSKTGSFDDPSIDTGEDAYLVGDGGKYDIQFSFASSNAGGGIHRFGPGESGTYTITGIPTLTANSFDFLSTSQGGSAVYPTAAHVQGIDGGTKSGWVSVPEPSAIWLAVLAAAGLFGHASTRRRT
jgi:PEP-CTERM motif